MKALLATPAVLLTVLVLARFVVRTVLRVIVFAVVAVAVLGFLIVISPGVLP